MNIITKIPPVTPFIEVKLDKEIIDYLWKIINNSKTENTNHKQYLAGNISKSYLLKDINNFFFESVCVPLITNFRHNNLGIEGTCGGSLSCATCHVIIDQEWFDKVGKPSEDEEDMLDLAFTAVPNAGNDEISLAYT